MDAVSAAAPVRGERLCRAREFTAAEQTSRVGAEVDARRAGRDGHALSLGQRFGLFGKFALLGAYEGDAGLAWGGSPGVVGRGLGVQLGAQRGGGFGGGGRLFYGGALRRYGVLDGVGIEAGVEVGVRVVYPGIACRADERRFQEGRGR
jgi:hypothetical protein